MVVNVVNFLPQAIIDSNLKMVGYTQHFRYSFDGPVHQGQGFRVGFVEILALFFGDYQKVHRGLGPMVGDYNNFIILVKDIGREFPVDDSGE